MNWREWPPYVPVAQRQKQGKSKASRLLRKGEAMAPVQISGRAIATTFWGKAWCDHFEQYSDYSNRLPRGRTYVRNGSVLHLRIESGCIEAIVCGSDLYQIKIEIDPLGKRDWKKICDHCATSVHNLIDLMRGKLPEDVIRPLTDPKEGMFPNGKEIRLSCSCPDWATMCKHVAAVIYGVGNRLDQSPELLFRLRGVDQNDLIGEALTRDDSLALAAPTAGEDLSGEDLSSLFGIELDTSTRGTSEPATKKAPAKRKAKTSTTKPMTKPIAMAKAKARETVRTDAKAPSRLKSQRTGAKTIAAQNPEANPKAPVKKKRAAKKTTKASSRAAASPKSRRTKADNSQAAEPSKPSKSDYRWTIRIDL